MVEYETTTGCRMAFLQRALDDDTAQPCGRCDGCAGAWYPTTLPEGARELAGERLRRAGVELEPRAQWPSGMSRLGVPVSGRIDAAERPATGRAVARLTDLGWGTRLRSLLDAPDQPVDPGLLDACVGVLRDWGWARRPVAVVPMASRRHPELVTSLAEGIARIGRLDLLPALETVDGGPTGEPGGNSAFRLAGVWDRVAVGPDLADRLREVDGPVLLVDDLADSRWTMTVAARSLRRAGADEVLPLALALAG
jgi:ATP-dependent DNA helicase RecQ